MADSPAPQFPPRQLTTSSLQKSPTFAALGHCASFHKRKAEHLYGVSDKPLVFAKRGAAELKALGLTAVPEEPIEPEFKLFPLHTGRTKLIPLTDDEEIEEASSPKQPPAVSFSPAQTPFAQTTSYSPTQPFPFNNILFPEDDVQAHMPPLALTLPASSQLQTPTRTTLLTHTSSPTAFSTPSASAPAAFSTPLSTPSASTPAAFLTPLSTPSAPAPAAFLTPLCSTTLTTPPKCMRKLTKYPTESPTSPKQTTSGVFTFPDEMHVHFDAMWYWRFQMQVTARSQEERELVDEEINAIADKMADTHIVSKNGLLHAYVVVRNLCETIRGKLDTANKARVFGLGIDMDVSVERTALSAHVLELVELVGGFIVMLDSVIEECE
ncbi:hypothetical protein T484DRAFT_1848218 [Baffinella frigidus]|nr:hypothetical protein T484DRAFT_1848218 [Cryptophyta sp. CCMP2293]